MRIFKNANTKGEIIISLYFMVATIEVASEMFAYKPMIFVFKPLISVLLMVLYLKTSNQRNALFFIVIFFSLLTNVFFIPNTEKMLFFGVITFLIHRVLTILYIVKLTKLKDCFPLMMGVIPFLLIFFYLFAISNEIPKGSYYLIIVQNILVSILGGIVLSDYVMNDNKKSVLLLIFGLLSVSLYFIVFIEKCYLSSYAPSVFRPLAMILNTVVYFVFYKFVIHSEKPTMESQSLYDN